MFVPSKTYRIIYDDSLCDIAVKNGNFCAHEISCHFLLESDFRLSLFADDYRQIPHVHQFTSEFLELQKYSDDTDFCRLFCFDRFCFSCVVCLF